MKTTQIIRAITLVITCSLNLSILAQTRIISPYSRFGVGELHQTNHATILGMGGTSAAFMMPDVINKSNPASYAAFQQQSFLFDVALAARFSDMRTTTLRRSANHFALGHVLVGFPVTRHWKTSIGVLPYSSVGYHIVDQEITPELGKSLHIYEGSGGIHQFYAGNALKIGNRISIGVNATYMFGTIEKNRSHSFPDSVYKLASRVLNTTTVSDFRFTAGMQYLQTLANNHSLVVGFVVSPEIEIGLRDKVLIYNFFPGTAGVDNIRDTIVNTPSEKGYMTMPLEVGGGVSINHTGRWSLGADFFWQNWEKYTFFGQTNNLRNSWRASAGAMIYPTGTGADSYWRRISYSFGVRYSQSFLELRNNQINEFGISFGLGLPMVRARSKINLGIELGTRGTTDDNLIAENFVRFSLGFSIIERWFEKRRYF